MKGLPVKFTHAIFPLSLIALTSGCTTTNLAYRDLTSKSAPSECLDEQDPVTINNRPTQKNPYFIEKSGSVSEGKNIQTSLRCSIQRHNNGDVSYDVAFVEFDEYGKPRVDKNGNEVDQWEALQDYIAEKNRQSKDLVVLAYVHGWRHDASISIGDVRRFHTIVSLTANYVRQRNQEKNVLGVYFGWRGRSTIEPPIKVIDSLIAFPSIFSRKGKSDEEIAVKIGEKIVELESEIHSHDRDHRYLIYGHSLGGNIVLRGLTKELKSRLQNTAHGEPIQGIGDLIVLVNPASEITSWKEIQTAEREYSGISPKSTFQNSYLDPNDCAKHWNQDSKLSQKECETNGSHLVFPPNNAPVLVSITASNYYRFISGDSKNPDSATGKLFPLMNFIKDKFTSEEILPQNRYALGHYVPQKKPYGRPYEASLSTSEFGIDHELEIDQAPGIKTKGEDQVDYLRTSYWMAGITDGDFTPRCDANLDFMDWQSSAIKNQPQEKHGRQWDATSVFLASKENSDDPKKELTEVEINVRHGVARNACSAPEMDTSASTLCEKIPKTQGLDRAYQLPTLGHAWSPYWNVGAHSNVIENHGGYVSATLWCFLSRMVLDKPRQTAIKD